MDEKLIPITVDYGNHTIDSKWKKSEHCCPKCGKKQVFVNNGAGDYYEGPEHACVSCETTFTLPSIGDMTDSRELQVLKALKASNPRVNTVEDIGFSLWGHKVILDDEAEELVVTNKFFQKLFKHHRVNMERC